jgi:quercetin dioxygenase-like cupin family protein
VTIRTTLAIAAVAITGTMGTLYAQQAAQPPIKRTPLQKVEVPGSSTHEAITGIAEIAPSVNIGRHTHPGAETGYLIEGDMTLLVEGKPPVALKAGDSSQIPVNAVHDARSGERGAKVLAVYIVEKGKPLASPAP